MTEPMNPATIKEAKALLKIYRAGDTPVFLHGPPGIGKSAAAYQVSQELKEGFIDIRATRLLPEDISGIPVPDLEKKMAIWLESTIWPRVDRDGPKGLICFDELSDVGKNVQTALYQVILDRRIGDFHLPDGWWPMAAGNRREDRAAAQAMSTALANRFAHLDCVEDYDCWREYANCKKLHHFVVGFLKHRPTLLHNMEGSDLRAYPTPRSWEEACKYVEQPPSTRMKLMRGLIGSGASSEFEGFIKGINIPDLKDEILPNPKKCRIPKEPACRYALSALLSQNLTRQTFGPIHEYIKREEFGRDFEVVTVIDAIRRDVSLMETKAYVDFAARNADISV